MPKSKKLWLQAAQKEFDQNPKDGNKHKLSILRKALEYIPSDVDLWKQTVALADKEEAKQLLYKGVQCVPESTDLWLALAKLENYENAKQVLNNAISIIPTD
jgi:pre-mRNA-processing factor 6